MSTPYEIERQGGDRAIVRFSPGDVTMNRTPEQMEELLSLVNERPRIAIDFSKNPLVPSDWLRAVERMRVQAVAAGKSVIIVGASETTKGTADALTLREKLKWCNTIEEAWTL